MCIRPGTSGSHQGRYDLETYQMQILDKSRDQHAYYALHGARSPSLYLESSVRER